MSSNKHKSINAFGISDLGTIRAVNEEAFLISTVNENQPALSENQQKLSEQNVLLAVADGGGAWETSPENFSKNALDDLDSILSKLNNNDSVQESLDAAFQQVHSVLYKQACADPDKSGFATTLTCALIKENVIYIAHVGNSRAYLLRGENLYQITNDDTLIRLLLLRGLVTEEEAGTHPHGQVILQMLGALPEIHISIYRFEMKRGDRLLLCTDGLWQYVSDSEIKSCLIREPDTRKSCELLIERAYKNKTLDNVTVIVADADNEGLLKPEAGERGEEIISVLQDSAMKHLQKTDASKS